VPRRGLRVHAGGFTLVEIILAVSTLAAVVLLATAVLRVGLRAWEAGQKRADVQQEGRALVEVVSDALAGAHPYRGRLGQNPERIVLFEGQPEEVRFVTQAPTLVLDAPAAPFHAVVLGLKEPEVLRLAEQLVPATDPFAPGSERVLSRAVTRFKLAYRDELGLWQERWDGRNAGGLPTAVRFELEVKGAGAAPAVVVPVPLGKRSQ
jgi:type II secretory pathway component PulJ